MPEILTAILGVGSLLAASLFVDNHVLSIIPHPRSPFFWGMLSMGAGIGLVLLTLHYLLMQRRGKTSIPYLSTGQAPASDVPLVPRWRDSWWVALVNVAVVSVLLVLMG